jgi:branched-chain amino acid transport system substrate-binding protein
MFNGKRTAPLAAASAVSIVMLAAACSSDGQSSAEGEGDGTRIGIYVPLTGAQAPIGIDMRDGAALAAEQFDEINGEPVTWTAEDTQSDPAAALSMAQRMVQTDGVDLLVGGTNSSETLALAAQAERLDVPIVATNSQAVSVTGEECSRYVFRTNPSDAMTAQANEIFLQNNPNLAESWDIVVHDNVWGQSNAAAFEEVEGIQIESILSRPVGTTDWSTALTELRGNEGAGIYAALLVGADLPAFINQARSFGIDRTILPPLGMPDTMLEELGDPALGLRTGGLFGSWTLAEDNPDMKAFVDSFFEEYDRVPGPMAIQAYQGTWWALEGIANAASSETGDVIESMEETRIDGILGEFGVRAEDHQGEVGMYAADVVQAEDNPYGAEYAWDVTNQVPWEELAPATSPDDCQM